MRIVFASVLLALLGLTQQVSCDLNPNEIPIQGSDEVPHLVQDMKFEAPEDLDASDKASSRATAWEQQGLDYHNYYRKRHGAPPLQLHPQLIYLSQQYANYLLKTNTFEHSGVKFYGENLYKSWGYPSNNVPAQAQAAYVAVNDWYKEVSMYSYGSGSNSATGHFTQVVWKSSMYLGIAKAVGNGNVIIVAHYYPQGNIVGQYAANVLPPVNG